jgi:hypothetical protein
VWTVEWREILDYNVGKQMMVMKSEKLRLKGVFWRFMDKFSILLDILPGGYQLPQAPAIV